MIENGSILTAVTPDEVVARPAEARHEVALRAGRERGWTVGMDRVELENVATARLAGRKLFSRTAGNVRARYEESFVAARMKLSNADLITLLVIDEALRRPQVVGELLRQARNDLRDRGAEHGGVLLEDRAVAYRSAEGERVGDHVFVAPAEMVGEVGLAHYHFHAAAEEYAEFAGPSAGDLEYAKRFNRQCVVLTSVGRGRLAADVYFPDGVVVDLGEIGK